MNDSCYIFTVSNLGSLVQKTDQKIVPTALHEVCIHNIVFVAEFLHTVSLKVFAIFIESNFQVCKLFSRIVAIDQD